MVVASLVWGLATYLIMTGLTPIVPRGDIVAFMIAVNIILIGAMIAILWVQIRGLYKAWRQKIPGARLHARVVALFSVIALIPAVTLATGSTITFSRGLETWFGQRTRAIIENSLEVANAYLEEHGAVIRADVVNMAKDLDDAEPLVARRTRGTCAICCLPRPACATCPSPTSSTARPRCCSPPSRTSASPTWRRRSS